MGLRVKAGFRGTETVTVTMHAPLGVIQPGLLYGGQPVVRMYRVVASVVTVTLGNGAVYGHVGPVVQVWFVKRRDGDV